VDKTVNCWDIGMSRSLSRFRFEAQVRLPLCVLVCGVALFVLGCDCYNSSFVDPALSFLPGLLCCLLILKQVFALAVKPDEPSRAQLAVGSVTSPERQTERGILTGGCRLDTEKLLVIDLVNHNTNHQWELVFHTSSILSLRYCSLCLSVCLSIFLFSVS
jgi:hypothetical protein